MKSTRKENKFSNLIDEKNRQRVESATINLARQRAKNETNESKEENKKDKEDKNNQCFRCD